MVSCKSGEGPTLQDAYQFLWPTMPIEEGWMGGQTVERLIGVCRDHDDGNGEVNALARSNSSTAWSAGSRRSSYTSRACGESLSRIQARRKKKGVIAQRGKAVPRIGPATAQEIR
jgi:hypothetical protein